ncbi:hypothetical protein [Leisingera sp. MMG026]|uniref:hypothetical protein n=1 Tax=Leisingera sp. MMG026 TaxID=2909982 RepID=UPI001F2ACF66|nr:hypothetical protein [Leisingera sp. MMG026]MCF6432639.1 hypothetical protein [Leisingera sp. MMG026]
MTPSRVTPAEIAEIVGCTEKHVRRMIGRARGAGHHVSPEWFGRIMRIEDGEHGPEVVFATLPDHIREAFVMLDQPELPLT